MKRTLLILCWIQACIQAYASFGWKKYAVEDGMFSSNITSIERDRHGYLWLGTSNGLYKFNGYNFEHYRRQKDTLSLNSNEILSLELDGAGNLWLLSESGIQEFSRKDNGFLPLDFEVNKPLKLFFDDNKGFILIEKKGLKIIRNKFQINEFPINENLLPSGSSISYSCKDQNKIFLSDSHSVFEFDLENNEFRKLYEFDSSIKSLAGHGNSVFVIAGAQLFKLSTENKPETELMSIAPRLDNALCLFKDDINNLWLTGQNGLYRYDGIDEFELKKTFKNWDGQTIIQDIYLDKNDIVWIASSTNGLLKYDFKPKKFHVHSLFNKVSEILSVKSFNNKVYVSLKKSGVHVIEDGKKARRIAASQNARIYNSVEGVLILDGNTLFSVDQNDETINLISEIPDSISHIHDILQIQPNELYISSEYGVYRKYNERFFRVFNRSVQALLLNGSDIYAGGIDGVYKFDINDSEKKFQALPTGLTDVSSMCKRGDSIYIGLGYGLYVLKNLENDKMGVERIEKFSNKAILSLELDAENRIWAATFKGLFCYNPVNDNLSHYGSDDGVPVLSGIRVPLDIDKNNGLNLGSGNGFYYCNLDSIPYNTNDHSPEVYFEKIIVRDSNVPVDTIFSPINNITVNGNRHVSIELSFFADDFTYPSENEFMYKLSGYDEDWISAGNSHKAIYYGLKPGKYLFQLQGANNDDTWSIGQKQISLEIESGFFVADIYKIIIPIVFALLAYLIIQYRTRKLRYANVILKEKDSDSQKISQQKEELTIKNKNITDSINYAKRIQEAMLPTGNDIKEIFPESFILFMPKDIVSGDFYWVYKNKNKKYIAAVDCTGHGVPGAFMSIIGVDLLRSFSQQNSMKSASQVLDALNKGVTDIFKQKGTDSEIVTDGMDISLCIIDEKEKKLEFAGAHHSLYLIRNNNIRELKGDRFSIGSGELVQSRNFTNQTLELKSNDMIYMFTDGYVDQFGGEEGKKYKYRRFRYLLLNIHRNPLEDQKEQIRNSLLEWKQDHEQVDDILIAGFKPMPV